MDKDVIKEIHSDSFGNEADIYSKPEQEQLDLVRETREKIIKSLIADGIPDNPKSLRLLNEILTAHEGGINSRANTRLKKQEIKSGELAKGEIVQILKNIRTNGEYVDVDIAATPSKPEDRVEKKIEVNLVHGHTSLVKDTDIAEEFLAKYEGGK